MLLRLTLCIGVAASVGLAAVQTATAEPPEYFERLIKEANVTFKFYDPVREPRTHRGYTTFHLDVRYRSSYSYRWTDRPGVRLLQVEPKIGPITYQLTNEVQLPHSLNTDRRWTNSLVKHEFDHVAMTVDPRVRMLIEYLCHRVSGFSHRLPANGQVNDALVERLIAQRVDPRYGAVIDMLLANEKEFDVVTSHGLRELPDRAAYFQSLFTEENLKQFKFPYLSEVRPLLRKKSYREAKLPYDMGE